MAFINVTLPALAAVLNGSKPHVVSKTWCGRLDRADKHVLEAVVVGSHSMKTVQGSNIC